MADDTPETPSTPTADTPAPRRRAAPRKAAAKPATPRKVKDAATRAEGTAVRAVKPRSTSRATTRPAATRATTATDTATPRARKKPGPKPGAKQSTPRSPTKTTKSTFDRATDAVGGRLAAAAIGAVAAGATVAAVLTLRGSSARNLGTTKKPIDISGTGDKGTGHPTDVHGGAHQPDGTDSSASFKAGIADENTVPGKR